MWLIILDRSGSMADPFAGLGLADVKGRTRLADDPSKWAAATRVVRDEVASLADEERVCVIAFNDTAETVFDGTPAQAVALQETLAGMTPTGGTALADAMAAALVEATASSDAQISVTVISDGLAEKEASAKAAAALAVRVGMIEVILIDPTPEGQAVAKSVAVRGRVTSIVSTDELRAKGREASQQHVEETSRVQRALARADDECLAVGVEVPVKERLAFTTGYPARPLVETWTPLSVYLHLCREDLEQEVRHRLSALAQQVGLPVADSRTSAFLNRGTWLTIRPRVEGVQFNPLSHVVAWFEDLQEVAFRFQVPQALASRSLTGSVEITGESGLWLADLPISLRALAPDESLPAGDACTELNTCRLPEQIFASYSHADRKLVETCAVIYKSLGVHLYIDRNDLTVGQEWHPGLLQLIDRSEVFQLYWSDTSEASPYVREEWVYALAQRGRKGARFVRGVYWREPMPALPEPLAGLHFGYLDLRALTEPEVMPVARALSVAAPAEPSVSSSETEAQAVPAVVIMQRAAAVQATLVPLLPGLTRHALAALREQVRLAAAFLESVTGLRYQPVPTFVIDEHLVQEVREVLQVVDAQPSPDASKAVEAANARADMEACRDVLRALLLEFHVRSVPPFADFRTPNRGAMPQIPGVSPAALSALIEVGEWALWSWTTNYFEDPSETLQQRTTAPARTGISPAQAALDTITEMAETAGNYAKLPSRADHELMATFERSTSSNPSALDEREAWNRVAALQDWPGLIITRKQVEPGNYDRPWWPKPDWLYEVHGTILTFARALAICRDRLAGLLPKLDGHCYTSPEMDDNGLQAVSYIIVASRLGYALESRIEWNANRLATSLKYDFIPSLHPTWRRARDYFVYWGMDEMAGLGFKDFLAAYLARMLSIFKFGLDTSADFFYRAKYQITQAGRDMALSLMPDLSFQVQRFYKSDEYGYLLTAPFEEFVELFERASQRLLQALDNLPGRDDAPKPTTVATRAVIETSTFGIFAPEDASHVDKSFAQWMVSRQAMPQLSMPGVPRVLYCLQALEAAAAKRDGECDAAAQPPAPALLSLALLVHEHFHALVDTAPGSDGLSVEGPRQRDDWAQATPLNESLAAWMEVQAMRELAPLLGTAESAEAAQQAVWGYIRSGAYPAWPYRGAERVQAIYDSEGLIGVRRLVNALRQHPVEARRAFDQMS